MQARLEGGPFDGVSDFLECTRESTPAEVRAWRCPDCKGVHITPPEVPLDGEPDIKPLRYRFDRFSDGAIYIYGETLPTLDAESDKIWDELLNPVPA